MKGPLAHILLLVHLLGLSSCAKQDLESRPEVVPADSTGTVLTPCLNEPIGNGRNVLWCSSFQIAWNELMDFAGGPVVMKEQPAVADALNKRVAAQGSVDPACLVARCGLVSDGIIPSIRAELHKKFGESADPRLLSEIRDPAPHWIVAFAYLKKALPFKTAFWAEQPVSFPTTQGEMEAFGIPDYLPQEKRDVELAGQVRVLFHCFDPKKTAQREASVFGDDGEPEDPKQRFIVELLPETPDERIILAKVQPAATLGATVAKVMLLAGTQGAVPWLTKSALSEGEKLLVPIIDINLRENFRLLQNKAIVSPKSMNGYFIKDAAQVVRFRLDEKGAKVESEALVLSLGDTPRRFVFDEPFLIMLIRRDASMPYFAMWVGNHRIMVPMKSGPVSPSHGNAVGDDDCSGVGIFD